MELVEVVVSVQFDDLFVFENVVLEAFAVLAEDPLLPEHDVSAKIFSVWDGLTTKKFNQYTLPGIVVAFLGGFNERQNFECCRVHSGHEK